MRRIPRFRALSFIRGFLRVPHRLMAMTEVFGEIARKERPDEESPHAGSY